MIIPYLENHLAIEQFEKINSDLKVKIASSEAHTNSTVKNLKDIKNIAYKSYYYNPYYIPRELKWIIKYNKYKYIKLGFRLIRSTSKYSLHC